MYFLENGAQNENLTLILGEGYTMVMFQILERTSLIASMHRTCNVLNNFFEINGDNFKLNNKIYKECKLSDYFKTSCQNFIIEYKNTTLFDPELRNLLMCNVSK